MVIERSKGIQIRLSLYVNEDTSSGLCGVADSLSCTMLGFLYHLVSAWVVPRAVTVITSMDSVCGADNNSYSSNQTNYQPISTSARWEEVNNLCTNCSNIRSHR